MISTSGNFPYFKLSNMGPAQFAFDLKYTSAGVPIYAYSKPIDVGTSKTILIPWNAINILFTAYVYDPPYRLIPIYRTIYWNASSRCFGTLGTVENPQIYRIPCFYKDNGLTGCNCCY